MNKDGSFDLWYIRISASAGSANKPPGVNCKLERYLVRATESNFISHKQPYLRDDKYACLYSRIPRNKLMEVETFEHMRGDYPFVAVNVYCLTKQKKEALQLLRRKMHAMLHELWKNAIRVKTIWETDLRKLENQK